MVYQDNWLNRGVAVFCLLLLAVGLAVLLVEFYRTARLPENRIKLVWPLWMILLLIISVIMLNIICMIETMLRSGLSTQQGSVAFLGMVTYFLLSTITGLLKNDRATPTPPS
jgi:hypothetical protein